MDNIDIIEFWTAPGPPLSVGCRAWTNPTPSLDKSYTEPVLWANLTPNRAGRNELEFT